MTAGRVKAYAIVNDLGVMFRDYQLLVYPNKVAAEEARARLNIADDGEFDGRVERVSIEKTVTNGDVGDGD